MDIQRINRFKIFFKNKILFGDYIFKIGNSSEFYYLYHKLFNKDIWKNIIKFIYPQRKQIINWKKNHTAKTYTYISLFKYLYRNSNNLNSNKNYGN